MVLTTSVACRSLGWWTAAAAWVLLGTGLTSTMCSAVQAQERPNRSAPDAGFDMEQMFDQMFGQQTPEQQQALAKVEISWQEEQQFGRQALDRFLADLKRRNMRVVSRGKEIERLQRLASAIRPQMTRAKRYRSITILLVESSETDARCFPAGTLAVFRGLIDAVSSDDALAGVIAHELSHIDRGHQLRYLKTMKLAQSTFSPVVPADFRSMMNNTMLLTRTFTRPFRPEEEAEADLDATTWIYRAGYDPRELAELFLTFEKRQGNKGQMMPEFFRTHPPNRQRREAVLQRYEELQRTEPRGK